MIAAGGIVLDDVQPLTCPEPVRRPVMVQQWNDVVFLHWRFEPEVVQQLLPDGVEVDTFDGSAWVGLVPFHMDALGIAGSGPLPFVGSFPEVNVRTYVQARGRVGVWFFSLDVDRFLPAGVARMTYSLPYNSGTAARVRAGDVVTSRVQRRWPRASGTATTEIAVRTGGVIDQIHPLVRFLTARWGLISTRWLHRSRAGTHTRLVIGMALPVESRSCDELRRALCALGLIGDGLPSAQSAIVPTRPASTHSRSFSHA